MTRRTSRRRDLLVTGEAVKPLPMSLRILAGAQGDGAMWIGRRRGWELPEREAVSEEAFFNRRQALQAGFGLVAAGLIPNAAFAQAADPTASLYPASRSARYTLDRPLTDEKIVTTYNNFYEFGSSKNIWRAAQALVTRPWALTIDGMVEKPLTLEADDLIRRMSLEERLYRFRCVEAWSMAVPWTGFGMKALVDLARPLGSARYVRMETFLDADVASGQRQTWYPWPYVEGCTVDEATNELAFMATGVFGKPLPQQMGAPIRLVLPWKYGFKSIKSIRRITFTDKRPDTFWSALQPREYGFWANVNPEVPHPRWSQASDWDIATKESRPTQLYNGYAEFVAAMYRDKPGEKLFM
jgi:sulfoxide reductase catalytic subunit YedY